MSSYWSEQTFELKFQVSDLILFRKRIPILAHACTLTEILAGTAPPPPEALAEERAGYLLRSCPGDARVHHVARHGGFITYTMAAYRHCYIDLRDSFSEYQARFSSKSRSTIARKRKKFEAHCKGSMRFERYAEPAEMEQFHALARQVSVLTYQEKLLDAGLPTDPDFVHEMLNAAADGNARGYLLIDGDRPVAYLYCPVVDGTLIYAYLGFDPACAEWSVGTILLWMSFESIFAEKRFSYFDFTEGESAQKQLFSTHQAPCHNTLHLRDTLTNRLLIGTHVRFDRASGRLGRILDRWGMKSAIKRLLRGR